MLIVLIPIPILKDKIVWLGVAVEIIILIIIPLIRCRFKNWLRVIIGIASIVVFELISLFVRNLGHYLESTSMMINLIMSIDYYIMLILYYLYNVYIFRKREVKNMGLIGPFFFGEADKVLIKEIAKEHKVSEEVVEKHYKEMLEAIKNEVKSED